MQQRSPTIFPREQTRLAKEQTKLRSVVEHLKREILRCKASEKILKKSALLKSQTKLLSMVKQLKGEVLRRRSSEGALKKSEAQTKRLLEQSQHMEQELRFLSHQLLSAQEDDRREISRELHDQVGQTLVGIHLNLASLTRAADINIKDLKQKISSTQRLVQRSMKSVQRFARELRPAQLDDLGLVAALHSYLKDYSSRTGIHARLTAFAGVDAMSIDKRTVFFRVTQEALNNIAKHANANQVTVQIKQRENFVSLEIQDDGKSFSVEKIMATHQHKRLGLLGMRERIEMVNGRFSVESVAGRGTLIRAQVPFSDRSKPS